MGPWNVLVLDRGSIHGGHSPDEDRRVHYSGGKAVGSLPGCEHVQTTTRTQGPDSRRGEAQIPADMDKEFGRRLRVMKIQHGGPVSAQVLLQWNDSIRCELWKETLAREQRHQGKILPSIQERYWSQYEVRVQLLGEQPHQEWIAELSRLIRAEMRLDESYRALHWYVAQVCPWTADHSPTEGFDYYGLGLLYWRLVEDLDFGSEREWRLEEIMEYRERGLNISDVLWAQEELEFLAVQEWELEIAYIQLLDSAQQQGGPPFAWDYAEAPADCSEITADVSAMGQSNSVRCSTPPMEAELLWRMQQVLTHLDEPVSAQDEVGWRNLSVQQPEEAVLNPQPQITESMNLIDFSLKEVTFTKIQTEVLTTEQSCASLYTAPGTSSLFYGQEVVNFYPQTPVPETGDLIDLSAEEEQPSEPTAEEHTSRHSAVELCLQHSLTLEELCKATDFSVCFPAEELASGQNITKLCPAPTAASVGLQETSPAEALATGQRVQDLCPTPAAVLKAQRKEDEAAGFPSQQQIAPQNDASNPAEELATGQSATSLCPQLTEEGVPVKVDGTSVSTDTSPEKGAALRQKDVSQASQALGDFLPAASVELQETSPAEALATGQRVRDLCPTPAAVLKAQGEKVAVTPEQQIRIQGEKVEEVFVVSSQQSARGEEVVFPFQQGFVHLGSSTRDMYQQPDEGKEDEAAGFPSPQQITPQNDASNPAEELATGQSATSLCLQLTEEGLPVKVDEVSNAIFGTSYLGYCVDTGIGGLELLTNFGVNPFGVFSCVSLLPIGEICDGSHFGWGACGAQLTSESTGSSWSSFTGPSYV